MPNRGEYDDAYTEQERQRDLQDAFWAKQEYLFLSLWSVNTSWMVMG